LLRSGINFIAVHRKLKHEHGDKAQMMIQEHAAKSKDTDVEIGAAQEYLTYTLGSEEYAIDILKVQEIRGYETPTTIANAPAALKGVINLRGTIVPIVDLRIKFNVGAADYTPFTVVIILNIGSRVIGIVVDGVSDVTMLRPDQIHRAPEFAATVDTKYIMGICTLDKRMLIVVNIEQLILSDEMALFNINL
jgi:purine-binding chemotaxis protein CheW